MTGGMTTCFSIVIKEPKLLRYYHEISSVAQRFSFLMHLLNGGGVAGKIRDNYRGKGELKDRYQLYARLFNRYYPGSPGV